ncbi:DUF4351 domain-containing protein [Pseudoduganella aquatica]|uniref:DUF4351 domain-containing protein n=1 Tax=Pseudoduganella aquatica TaxID=2660641 RepID=UPI001E456CEB|nr:DUF4351 domain-containing protein [Pseudoduganella aquatica]
MPNIAPPARFDLPWKRALTHAFRAFMAFFFAELCIQIDWSKRPRLRDKELASIGFGDAPDGMVADKLVEVCLRDGSVQWVLIPVEVQAQRDASLARRVLDYNYRIFKEYARPVASLVLLADDDPGWQPHAFHNQILGTVMGISFATAKLLDYADRTDALLASHNPFAWITLAHLRTQQARHDADQLYVAKWQLTKLLYRHGWSKRRIIVLFNVINWMMALPATHQDRYWQAVLQMEKERKMEWITPLEQSFMDKGWQKGLEKGLEKGILQGRKEGAAALLERLLTQRFGPLPQTARKKLAKASAEQLTAWSDALMEAQSLKQVFE